MHDVQLNKSKDISVALASNSSHYRYAALAYQKKQYLEKFITTIFIKERDLYQNFQRINNLLSPRYLKSLDGKLVESLYLSEIRSFFLNRFSNKSQSEIYRISNEYFGSQVCRKLEKSSFNIFHFISGLGLESIDYAKSRGAKIICDQRGTHFLNEINQISEEFKNSGKSWSHPENAFFDRLMMEYELSDYIIVNSNYTKKTFLNAGFCESKVKTLHLGVDTNTFSPSTIKQTDKFKVIFVGTIYPRKGIEYLLKAWKNLSLPNSELILVGGTDQYFDIKNFSNVKLIEHIPHSKMIHYLKESSLMVLPSVEESFGLVGLEGMSCGLPLITTDHCGVSEIVTNEYNGFTITTRDIDALASKIELLFVEKDLLYKMSENARKTALVNTWGHYGDKLNKIVEKISKD